MSYPASYGWSSVLSLLWSIRFSWVVQSTWSYHQDESLQCYNCSFLLISFFLIVVAITSVGCLWAFAAIERPCLSKILHFPLHSGQTKHSLDFTLNYWSLSFAGILIKNFWPRYCLCFGQDYSRNCNTSFLLCCAWQIRIFKPVQYSGLLHTSETLVSKATYQSLAM